MKKIKIFLKKNYLFLVILLLAITIRSSYPDLIVWDHDQDSLIDEVSQLIDSREVLFLGPAAGFSEICLGPLQYYLFAIPYLIFRSTISFLYFTVFLNIFLIIMIYIFCKQFFNERVALISSALFAVCPYTAIIVSRTVRNEALLPFFIVLFFYSVYQIIFKNKQIYLALSFLFLGCALQLHLTTISFILLGPILLILFRPKIDFKYLILGGVLFLFIFSPYIYFEFTNNFKNIRAASSLYLQNKDQKLIINQEVFKTALTPTDYFDAFLDDNGERLHKTNYFLKINDLEKWLFWISLSYLFGYCVFFLIFKCQSAKIKFKKYFIILLWFFIPLLLLMNFSFDTPLRYYLLLFPAHFLMIGIFIDSFLRFINNFLSKNFCNLLKISVFLFLLLVIFSQTKLAFDFYNIVDEFAYIKSETPLKYKKEIVNTLIEKFDLNIYQIRQKVHTFDVINRKGGFDSIAKLLRKRDILIGANDPQEHLVVFENKHLNSFRSMNYNNFLSLKHLSILAYNTSIDHSKWKYKNKKFDSWFGINFDDSDWEQIQMPFYGTLEQSHFYIRGLINLPENIENYKLIIQGEPCIQTLYFNEKKVVNNKCQEGRRLSEQLYTSSDTEIDLTPFICIGKNVLAIEMVNIDRGFDIEIYDLLDFEI